ncbi:hypothetical protein Lalb_Chr16g0387181 [Lupinus albus]|uniref:Uncharacterized protein n=1 Tax=Lupinus albus TaxID=3870 RepID=A0A6A4P7D0_LUPAL|nr:hypothetical protein Lalb_Chr16g0387181 [Lupinus albus]
MSFHLHLLVSLYFMSGFILFLLCSFRSEILVYVYLLFCFFLYFFVIKANWVLHLEPTSRF